MMGTRPTYLVAATVVCNIVLWLCMCSLYCGK